MAVIERRIGDDQTLEIEEAGEGRAILFLHPSIGMFGADRALVALSQNHHVVAPSHPGFGGSDRPSDLETVEDLAYFYLHQLSLWGLHDVVVVGVALGAWIAAAMAVKDTRNIAGLVLADPVGIKLGGPLDRDIFDLFNNTTSDYNDRAFADPTRAPRPSTELTEAELLTYYRNREATTLYAWSPYMYDPKLRARLKRIDRPTLCVWSDRDRIIDEKYVRAFASEIPGARFAMLTDAGHFPHVEQPQAFAVLVTDFIKTL